jgi:ribonuclease D
LADVPGVGATIAERYGGTILGALGVDVPVGPRGERGAAERALEEWRSAVAREMGVPTYVVLGDRALAQLAIGEPGAQRLHRAGGGPRFRAKFDAELRRLLARLGRPGVTSGPPPDR